MIHKLLAMYRLQFANTIAYMLQATEYNVAAYLRWLFRVEDFQKVMYRRELVMTRAAKMLLLFVTTGMIVQIIISAGWLGSQIGSPASWSLLFATILLLSTPLVWSLLAVLPLLLGRWLVIVPLTWFQVRQAARLFAKHRGTKIAIAGSYGKTTMKEILWVVLAQGKKVSATPANRNVARSHAQFAKSLKGDEDILIVEFGEGAPGDVDRFSQTVKPDVGIITGLAPAHLDKYKTLEAAAEDIFSLANYLKKGKLYVNQDSEALKPYTKKAFRTYGQSEADGWKIEEIKSDIHGLSFSLKKGSSKLELKSQLIGRHQLGPLAIAAILGNTFGLSDEQIKTGIGEIKPFHHRMQPKKLHEAWLIDDTYNGNIEGMKAGLNLLKELKAKRKIYITPGLVDQGAKSADIHNELGWAIATAAPDVVVLMKHSVTTDIKKGLKEKGFEGQLMVENDPLNFYTNLDKFVASGDLVLMQNDWPDNYN